MSKKKPHIERMYKNVKDVSGFYPLECIFIDKDKPKPKNVKQTIYYGYTVNDVKPAYYCSCDYCHKIRVCVLDEESQKYLCPSCADKLKRETE